MVQGGIEKASVSVGATSTRSPVEKQGGQAVGVAVLAVAEGGELWCNGVVMVVNNCYSSVGEWLAGWIECS